MPIRTNRGRAAVYRKLWGWPLRSPRHLGVAVFIAVLVIAGAGVLLPRVVGTDRGTPLVAGSSSTAPTTTTRSGPRPDPGPGGNATPTTSLPTRITSAPSSPSTAPPSPEALEVARSWVERWADHPDGVTSEQWLDGLRPYTTEEYMAVLATVEPANVPATRVTGDPEATTSYGRSVEADVPTDGGVVRLTVIDTGTGWRVANYEQGG